MSESSFDDNTSQIDEGMIEKDIFKALLPSDSREVKKLMKSPPLFKPDKNILLQNSLILP